MVADAGSAAAWRMAPRGEQADPPPLDDRGQIVVAKPPGEKRTFGQVLLFHTVSSVLIPAFIAFKLVTDKLFRSSFPATPLGLYSLVSAATVRPIVEEWYFQDERLLRKLWELPSARAYVGNLEYQQEAGFCGSSTQRCVLRSYGLRPDALPPQKRGESKPVPWCEHIREMAADSSESRDAKVELQTKIVWGSVSYEEFLSTLQEGLANENVRVACNYLRSALTGFQRPWFHPTYLLSGMMAGHISPILGIVEHEGGEGNSEGDGPFVAVFDTNHEYNGVYFVPARRLHTAVGTMDMFANSHRAVMLVEKV